MFLYVNRGQFYCLSTSAAYNPDARRSQSGIESHTFRVHIDFDYAVLFGGTQPR